MAKTHFENAPINEIVFGVGYTGNGFTPMHYGWFWEEVKDQYDFFSTQTPLLNASQISKEILGADEILPRIWLRSSDNHELIQLQRDRFFFNWRKLKQEDKYPHFESLFSKFSEHWKNFSSWSQNCAQPFDTTPSSYEMTYVNHIDDSFGWNGPNDTNKFLSFIDGSLLGDKGVCIAGDSKLNFKLTNNMGNLIATVRSGVSKRDKKTVPVLIFELTLRGSVKGESTVQWYNSAHSILLDVFLKLTTPEGREIWKSKGGN